MQTSLNKNSNFFERLLEFALKEGIKGIPGLATKLGYKSPEKLYRLQRNPETKPSFDIIADIAKSFSNIDLRWLITGEKQEVQSNLADSDQELRTKTQERKTKIENQKQIIESQRLTLEVNKKYIKILEDRLEVYEGSKK